MALFKIFKGKKSELDQVTNCKEGFAYFTTDSGDMYVDVASTLEGETETPETIAQKRIQVGGSPTSRAYNVVLEPAQWREVAVGPDSANPSQTVYKYEYDLPFPDLKCGKDGKVPPIISCTDEGKEYSVIKKADATPGQGILITGSRRPENNINLVILDDLK